MSLLFDQCMQDVKLDTRKSKDLTLTAKNFDLRPTVTVDY